MSLLSLFHSARPTRCNEFNLVLQAVNIDSQVVNYENRFYLLVEEHQAADAYQQLKLYVNENVEEEVISRPLMPFSKGFSAAYLYGLVLLVIAALSNTNALGFDWHGSGLAHSVKISNGQWWRTITALTLHADSVHLLSNIGFGALFGIFVSRYIGSGAAWFTILVAGALGNALNAYLHLTVHVSIGASTMVFAALGMLGIFVLDDHKAYSHRGLRRWAPFIATLALLGFLGTAGERTDIMAHLTGYICGCISGLFWLVHLSRRDATIVSQAKFAIASLGLLGLAWLLALII